MLLGRISSKATRGWLCQPSACAGYVKVLYYALLGRPSPVLGILDFYLLVPLGKLFQKQWRVSELTLRDRMGGGNFGQARTNPAGRFPARLTLGLWHVANAAQVHGRRQC